MKNILSNYNYYVLIRNIVILNSHLNFCCYYIKPTLHSRIVDCNAVIVCNIGLQNKTIMYMVKNISYIFFPLQSKGCQFQRYASRSFLHLLRNHDQQRPYCGTYSIVIFAHRSLYMQKTCPPQIHFRFTYFFPTYAMQVLKFCNYCFFTNCQYLLLLRQYFYVYLIYSVYKQVSSLKHM